jgi:drug/metabolite transporter (DMT)-like permease
MFALGVWSVQRAVSKAVLATLSTPQFYMLSAVVSLPFYLPLLAIERPPLSALAGALGLSALMAVTFGITTEAIRRGPVGLVSPITGLSPALTVLLALRILGERLSATGVAGVVLALAAVVLLGYGTRGNGGTRDGWSSRSRRSASRGWARSWPRSWSPPRARRRCW